MECGLCERGRSNGNGELYGGEGRGRGERREIGT